MLILEPGSEAHQGSSGASFTVHSAQVLVRGTATDPSGIYRVTVRESPVRVGAHGTFATWVKLRFGCNDLWVDLGEAPPAEPTRWPTSARPSALSSDSGCQV